MNPFLIGVCQGPVWKRRVSCLSPETPSTSGKVGVLNHLLQCRLKKLENLPSRWWMQNGQQMCLWSDRWKKIPMAESLRHVNGYRKRRAKWGGFYQQWRQSCCLWHVDFGHISTQHQLSSENDPANNVNHDSSVRERSPFIERSPGSRCYDPFLRVADFGTEQESRLQPRWGLYRLGYYNFFTSYVPTDKASPTKNITWITSLLFLDL